MFHDSFNNLNGQHVSCVSSFLSLEKGRRKEVEFEDIIAIADLKCAVIKGSSAPSGQMKMEPEFMYVQGGRDRHHHSVRNVRKSSITELQQCKVCGEKNHTSNRCFPKESFCYFCKIQGHLSPMCPTRKQTQYGQNSNVSDKADQHYVEVPNSEQNSEIFNFFEEEDYTSYSIQDSVKPIVMNIQVDNGRFLSLNLDTG
ncbi:hypothetical protein WA026_023842 [Henosepilachna vigintioctopunctata]|uniref:CCHC-type domain-containing protein n=1 Tax=Henosepilachna vigintioctopunctata TaxID=420089 RepID=A0AAW1V6G3_9CUCU